MEWSKPLNEKELFIRNEILSSTVAAAFGRAGIYRKESDAREQAKLDVRKEGFRSFVRKCLVEIGEGYNPHEDPFRRILDLKRRLESDAINRHILKNDRISFGVVQKLVNLYVKYLWCLGVKGEPSHCPVDRLILVKSKQENLHPWTLMSEEKYKEAINKIEQIAKGEGYSIAMWELFEFNGGNRTYKPRSVNNLGRKKSEKDLEINMGSKNSRKIKV